MHAQIPQSSGNANKMIHPNVLQSNFTLPSSAQTMKQPTTPTTSQLAPQFRSNTSTSNYGTMSQFSPATHSSSSSLPTTSSSQSQTISTPNRPGQAQVIPAQQSTSALQQKKKAEEALRIPEKVEALFPDSQLYTQLLSLEKKIDLCINRRKMELKEALRVTPTKTIRTLRVTISNTHNNHEPFYHTDTIVQHSTSEAPSWTLKIEGRLLDEAQVQPVKGFTQAQPTSTQVKTPKRKFSTYVRKIVVMLDQKAYPENYMIEWMNSNQSEYDGFEIKRKGKVDIPIKVFIYPEYRPAQFKLSPMLAKTLSVTADTRLRVMMALWQYIKVNRLQSPEDKRIVTCNSALKEIFGKEKISFLDLPNLITEHLSPPDPIELNYIIKTSGVVLDHHFDIHIQQEDASFLSQTPEATQTAKELEQVENQIIKHLSEVNQKKRKRDFMMGFSVNPVDFLNNVMVSQIRDFKVTSSDVGKDDEEERHARFYFQPFVYDAVQQYLHSTD